MKEFLVYTALRLLLLAASFVIVLGAWSAIADSVPLLWALVLAFAISGVGSYYLLNRQRDAFARRVEERAQRASSAFEERRSREDVD